VDADHATRELSTLAGAATLPGLTELAEGASDVVRNGGGQRSGWMVSLLPVGRRVVNPAAFYRTVSFRAALASVGRIADLVLVVAPPVLGQADASILADAADAVLLVLTESVTDEELRQAKTSLSWSRGALLGYVLIEQPESRFASRRTPPAVEVDDGASTPPQDSTWSLSAFLEPLRVVPRTGNPINGRGAAPPVHRGRAPVRVASSSGKEQPA
jgi:hypothetical protein